MEQSQSLMNDSLTGVIGNLNAFNIYDTFEADFGSTPTVKVIFNIK